MASKISTDGRPKVPIYNVFDMHQSRGIDADILEILNSNLIYNRNQIESYSKFNRFGYFDPYNKLTQTKEYLFFTKPDCHIWKPGTTSLQNKLKSDQFFIDLSNRYPHVIQQLQRSAGKLSGQNNLYTKSPFMNLLSNSVKSTLDFTSLSATEMEGPSNMYGTHINYRKDAWNGDENVDFSLEFEDTKYLEVYMITKAYEQYERYKTAGIIYPPTLSEKPIGEDGHVFCSYIKNKELHDTMGIFKFIVDETYENIVYYGYACGAYINSVPRDAFNDIKQGDGLTFTVDFKAFCILDSDPLILYHFNNLVNNAFSGYNLKYKPVYKLVSSDHQAKRARINGKWVTYPKVVRSTIRNSENGASGTLHPNSGSDGMRYIYRLVWY